MKNLSFIDYCAVLDINKAIRKMDLVSYSLYDGVSMFYVTWHKWNYVKVLLLDWSVLYSMAFKILFVNNQLVMIRLDNDFYII